MLLATQIIDLISYLAKTSPSFFIAFAESGKQLTDRFCVFEILAFRGLFRVINMHEGCDEVQVLHDYFVFDRIGKGAFSKVYRAQHIKTGYFVALKAIEKYKLNEHERGIVMRELDLLKKVNHPYIAAFYEFFEDDRNYYFVMEYVEKGNLLDKINANRGLDEKTARKVFVQVVSALDYLHNELKIVHRDLKPENVMIDKHDDVKLIDFGLSRGVPDVNSLLSTPCGTPAYASPELIRGESYSFMTDVWACGVMLYSMLLGRHPFMDTNVQTMLKSIVNSEPILQGNLPENIKFLLTKMMSKRPEHRPSFKEIMESDWINGTAEAKIYLFARTQIENEKFIKTKIPFRSVTEQMKLLSIPIDDLETDLNQNPYSEIAVTYNILKHNMLSIRYNFDHANTAPPTIKATSTISVTDTRRYTLNQKRKVENKTFIKAPIISPKIGPFPFRKVTKNVNVQSLANYKI